MENMENSGESEVQTLLKIRDMPEYELRERLFLFNKSIYIFNQNFTELEAFLKVMLDPHDPRSPGFVMGSGSGHFTMGMWEVNRRLHNFVAAAKTLVDHSLKFYNEMYKENGRFPEYPTRVKEVFESDPLTQFIQRFRQYVQHYRSPDIGLRENMNRIKPGGQFEITRSIYIKPKKLLEFEGWNAASKKYIEAFGEKDIDLIVVTTAYRDKIAEFYQWFGQRQREIHAAEFERLEEKEAQLYSRGIETAINGCMRSSVSSTCHEQSIFFPFSTPEFLEKLALAGDDRKARADRAIELLGEHFTLPQKLKDKIHEMYQQPQFGPM